MKIFIYAFIFFLYGCISFEPLTQIKKNFIGSNLKLNGYYYSFDYKKIKAFTLFKNGVFYNNFFDGIDSYYNENLDSLDTKYLKHFLFDIKYPLQYQWGLFNINNSEISIERWVTASGGGAYPTQMLKGTIKNDTTIYFHTLVGAHPINVGKMKKIIKIDETYHFRKFSPKPDSTNNFIK